jgi:S-DNA-T family DNA segregation ATPase FtsK/SpoIIIE
LYTHPNGFWGYLYAYLPGFMFPVLYLVVALILLAIWGIPKGYYAIANDLCRAGIVNYAEEPPLLIQRTSQDGQHEILIFYANGISKSVWLDERTQENAETALNAYIIDAEPVDGLKYVAVSTIPATYRLPTCIEWDNCYICSGPVLNMGVAIDGPVTVNLESVPHILIGGSTGSGKTILLKCLVAQCIAKGYQVIISDLKGGADYGSYFRQHCHIALNTADTLEKLKATVNELLRRQALFNQYQIKNLEAYNRMYESPLPHLIFACDEVSQLLDKTGLDKEAKQVVVEMEGYLSTIARQGRSVGINLMLGTQRPDANVLSGQIKSNIDCRVCGRASQVLSQIILDSSEASTEISKSAHGRFLTMDGKLFQAYKYDVD